jgi:hypothetical protein
VWFRHGGHWAWGDRLVICPPRWNEVIRFSPYRPRFRRGEGPWPWQALLPCCSWITVPYRIPPRPRNLTINRITSIWTAQRRCIVDGLQDCGSPCESPNVSPQNENLSGFPAHGRCCLPVLPPIRLQVKISAHYCANSLLDLEKLIFGCLKDGDLQMQRCYKITPCVLSILSQGDRLDKSRHCLVACNSALYCCGIGRFSPADILVGSAMRKGEMLTSD